MLDIKLRTGAHLSAELLGLVIHALKVGNVDAGSFRAPSSCNWKLLFFSSVGRMQQIKRGKPGLFGLIRIQQSSLPIPSTLWARCHPVPPSATGDVEGPGGHRPWQLAGAPGAPTQQPKLCPAQKLRVEFSATSDAQFLFLNDKNWCQKVSRTVQSNGILERDFVTCLPASG